MKPVLWISRFLTRQLPPEDLVDLGVTAWLGVWQRIPRERRVDFLKRIVGRHLGAVLADLSREERATLMNGLLPLVAREFPLDDLDFLTAFPIQA